MCDMEVETFRSERENTIIFGIKYTMALSHEKCSMRCYMLMTAC